MKEMRALRAQRGEARKAIRHSGDRWVETKSCLLIVIVRARKADIYINQEMSRRANRGNGKQIERMVGSSVMR